MIPIIQLANSGLKTSRLVFGTSRLHYVARAERQLLLAAAADCGVKHFDTAPAYGDGLAEREIGLFIRRRRSQLLVATKYGIPPNPLIATMPALAFPIRATRAVAHRAGYWPSWRSTLTAKGLIESVQQSLRRLGTDWIDILLLHEPSRDRIHQPKDWSRNFCGCDSTAWSATSG